MGRAINVSAVGALVAADGVGHPPQSVQLSVPHRHDPVAR